MVDVRVAAWLLDPDACGSSSVSDSLELDSKVRSQAVWNELVVILPEGATWLWRTCPA